MESVPNVQELVRNDPLQVPESFLIGNEEEEDKLQSTTDKYNPSSEIPIIDLSLLSRGSEEELHKLDKACEEWGFFQVIIVILGFSFSFGSESCLCCQT